MIEQGISFRIGVTGHRDILPEDVEGARQKSRELLSKIKSAMPATRITVISGLAEGADRIFAEAALELDMSVEAVILRHARRALAFNHRSTDTGSAGAGYPFRCQCSFSVVFPPGQARRRIKNSGKDKP